MAGHWSDLDMDWPHVRPGQLSVSEGTGCTWVGPCTQRSTFFGISFLFWKVGTEMLSSKEPVVVWGSSSGIVRAGSLVAVRVVVTSVDSLRLTLPTVYTLGSCQGSETRERLPKRLQSGYSVFKWPSVEVISHPSFPQGTWWHLKMFWLSHCGGYHCF
jgi:hypothetical protein